MNVAKSERLAKDRRPELFCAVPSCLWRVVTSTGIKPCEKHPVKQEDK